MHIDRSAFLKQSINIQVGFNFQHISISLHGATLVSGLPLALFVSFLYPALSRWNGHLFNPYITNDITCVRRDIARSEASWTTPLLLSYFGFFSDIKILFLAVNYIALKKKIASKNLLCRAQWTFFCICIMFQGLSETPVLLMEGPGFKMHLVLCIQLLSLVCWSHSLK